MHQSTVPAAPATPLREELLRRVMLGLFIFLAYICSKVATDRVEHGHTQLVMGILFEIPFMIVVALLFGKNNVTRDINELNAYSVLIHTLYLPFYFQGVPAIYHNVTIKVLICLAILRLLYIGPRTAEGDFKGMPTFGLLGHGQQLFDAWRVAQSGPLFQYWPHVFFFGTALPFWFVMVRSNDLVTTTVVAALMVFIFFVADYLHSHLARLQHQNRTLQARVAALEANQVLTADDVAIRATPRDVARQLLENYKATHPSMRNLAPALAIYMSRNFADVSVFGTNSISARRAQATTQLAELIFLAKEQFAMKEQLGPECMDVYNLTSCFDQSLRFDLDKSGFSAFMTYVLGIKALALQDSTFLLACDVLTTAWLGLLLAEDRRGYMADYPTLEAFTREFVQRHMPFDPTVEEN